MAQSSVLPWNACGIQQLLEDPNFSTYSSDYWQIVNEPAFASGKKDTWKGDKRPHVHYINWPQAPGNVQTFTRFAELPTELRLKIWKFALPDSRVVSLYIDKSNGSGRYLAGDPNHLTGRDLMLTCQESRTVFEENYYRIPVWDVVGTGAYDLVLGWLNAKQDTLVIDADLIQTLDRRREFFDLSKIENFALARARKIDNGLPIWNLAHILCPELKRFTAVLDYSTRGHNPSRAKGSLQLLSCNDDILYAEILCPSRREARPPNEWDWYVHKTTHHEDQFKEYIERADGIRRTQAQIAAQDPAMWSNVTFDVAFLVSKEEQFVGQKKWLKPVNRLPYDAIFVSHQNARGDDDYFLRLFELNISVCCNRDGSLEDQYSGFRGLLEM